MAEPLPDLAHFRSHGLDRLLVYCSARDCWHEGTVAFAELTRRSIPETATVVDLRRVMSCSRCGASNPDVRPDWSQRPSPLSRLP